MGGVRVLRFDSVEETGGDRGLLEEEINEPQQRNGQLEAPVVRDGFVVHASCTIE